MADKKIIIQNVDGGAGAFKKDDKGNVIRGHNRGYYDVAVMGDARFEVKIGVGETAEVGNSKEKDGVNRIPQWAYDVLTGKIKDAKPSAILARAMREGVIKIVGDSGAANRVNPSEKQAGPVSKTAE